MFVFGFNQLESDWEGPVADPQPMICAPITKPHPPTPDPDIWTNRSAAQPFTIELCIKARILAYFDT